MISKPKRRCVEMDCQNFALWGMNVARHCDIHRNPDELNLVHENCAACHLPGLLSLDTRLCDTCDPETRAYYRGRKERVIKHVLQDAGLIFVHDKVVDGHKTCGGERPDFRFEDATHVTVVEVDENQHERNSQNCEVIRMMNLCYAQWLPHVFIRYNPDEFKTDGHIYDCDDKYRHAKLLEAVRMARALPIVEDPRDMLRVTYLFYDGYRRGTPTVFESLNLDGFWRDTPTVFERLNVD